MKKRLPVILCILVLLASGLWMLFKNQPSAMPPSAVRVDEAGKISPTVATDITASPVPAKAAVAAPKIVPRPVAAVVRREGVLRVPTASDAVPIGGHPPAAIPIAPDFLEHIVDALGKNAAFALPDGRAAAGTVELLRRDADGVLLVQGRLALPENGFFFFQRQTVPGVAGAFVGRVRFDESTTAFRVDPTGAGGAPMLVEHRLDHVLCLNLEPPDLARTAEFAMTENAPQAHPINIPIPDYQNGVVPLQSLPGASGTIYLDFDGEKGPFSGWGNFDAAPSGATNAQIKDVWQRPSSACAAPPACGGWPW